MSERDQVLDPNITALLANAEAPKRPGRPSKASLLAKPGVPVPSTREERLAAARAHRVAALAACTPAEARFAAEYARLGNARDAVRVSSPDLAEGNVPTVAARLRQRSAVRAAVRAEVALRDLEAGISFEESCELLEAALRVRVSDLIEWDDSGQRPIGFKARETLSPAEELRVSEMECRVHASSKGERGQVRRLHLKLVSPIEILSQLAKLRQWHAESPELRIHLHQLVGPNGGGAQDQLLVELLTQVSDALMSDEEATRFALALTTGPDQDAREILAAALSRARGSRVVNAEAEPLGLSGDVADAATDGDDAEDLL